MAEVDIDVAVVGAGISGINAGYHIQSSTKLSYQIYDTRDEIGGTWSLFNFTGIRSDVDMFSYAYPFRPWTGDEAIADGAQIKRYLKDVAREFGIDKKINYGHRVQLASWSSEAKRWTLRMIVEGEKEKVVTSRFLFSGAGYYNHNKGYYPELTGRDDFQGQIVRPQFWPEDFNFRDKKVVILGSGSTTTTLFPNMVNQIGDGSVTVLQRSPSYYLTISKTRPIINMLRRWFPWPTNWILRIYSGYYDFVRFMIYRTFPRLSRWYLRRHVAHQLPSNVPLDPHFDPKYLPWHQRLCFVPDGDFFKALQSGKGGHIATGTIDTLVKDGIKLNDGSKLECDIIVQATGLELCIGASIPLQVDGKNINAGETFWYRGHMLSNIPNFVLAQGYFFQGYTLGSDIASRSFIRLANHMARNGFKSATPTPPDDLQEDTTEHVNPGYFLRAIGTVPRTSFQKPWIQTQEWFSDWIALRFGKVDEDIVFA